MSTDLRGWPTFCNFLLTLSELFYKTVSKLCRIFTHAEKEREFRMAGMCVYVPQAHTLLRLSKRRVILWFHQLINHPKMARRVSPTNSDQNTFRILCLVWQQQIDDLNRENPLRPRRTARLDWPLETDAKKQMTTNKEVTRDLHVFNVLPSVLGGKQGERMTTRKEG